MAVYTTIDDPEAYFQVKLYTGDGSTPAITLDGDTDMQPDLVWLKQRSGSASSHKLYDAVRGTTKYLAANNTGAEGTESGVTAFGSDGFTLGSAAGTNANTETYVAWCWKESATAGFDILTYEGNGSARTISHSLSAVPKFYVTKDRSATANWAVYHAGNTSAPETDFLILNTNAATADNAAIWNDTAPTSSVFSVGTDNDVNDDGDSFIAYLFADVQGYSKFGKYTGNGNADGPFVYLGFRPAWFMQKNTTDAADNWHIFDTKRDPFNSTDEMLFANANSAEATGNAIDFVSNGVKIRNTSNGMNGSGDNYVYAAFAEAPFVNSNGVPCNAR